MSQPGSILCHDERISTMASGRRDVFLHGGYVSAARHGMAMNSAASNDWCVQAGTLPGFMNNEVGRWIYNNGFWHDADHKNWNVEPIPDFPKPKTPFLSPVP